MKASPASLKRSNALRKARDFLSLRFIGLQLGARLLADHLEDPRDDP